MTHVEPRRAWTLRSHQWHPQSDYCVQCGLTAKEAIEGKHIYCDDDAVAVKALIRREPRDG